MQWITVSDHRWNLENDLDIPVILSCLNDHPNKWRYVIGQSHGMAGNNSLTLTQAQDKVEHKLLSFLRIAVRTIETRHFAP